MTFFPTPRLDTGVAELYPSPGPRWHSIWQVAALFGINDSSVRRLVGSGRFPGATKNDEGVWIIPSEGVIARLRELVEQAERDLIAPGPHTYVLYRWYDREGRLLYVGQSKDAPRRTRQHEQASPWFELTASNTVEHFETLDQVLAAERHAIKSERPIYNKIHNAHRARP